MVYGNVWALHSVILPDFHFSTATVSILIDSIDDAAIKDGRSPLNV